MHLINHYAQKLKDKIRYFVILMQKYLNVKKYNYFYQNEIKFKGRYERFDILQVEWKLKRK